MHLSSRQMHWHRPIGKAKAVNFDLTFTATHGFAQAEKMPDWSWVKSLGLGMLFCGGF
jgi:hypothetical protein